ncbi:MAG TPA: hypothetical protein VN671_14040 [Solirubrobacterales bacterium]|nr:hypothetical protein [Solirubrobacterales bacterium]
MTANVKRPPSPLALPEKVVAIHHALTEARVPHAVGGALALAYYAEPRSTVDVDVNIFIAVDRWPFVRDALAPLEIDVTADESALERDGQVRLWWGRNPVDLFFSYDSLHEEMEGATRRVPFGGIRIPILAPEHLVICKAIFDRYKDWGDIEAILVVTEPLDVDLIDSWLRRLVGDDDPRVSRMRDLVDRLLA